MTISARRRWDGLSRCLGIAAMALAGGWAALAQYPGHIDPAKKDDTAAPALRATAVVEWTGDRGRPSATRLIPVSLYDGKHLQDGGLYLARPVPLALDSGTEYELESSGVPQGWFDLDGARLVGQDWFGWGKWKPYVPPAPKRPKTTHQAVTVVGGTPADDRPHFKRREAASTAPAGGAPDATSKDTQNQDNAGKDSTNDSGSAQTASDSVDPNRPRLRRRAQEKAEQAEALANAPETTTGQPDSDRPRLTRGKAIDGKTQAQFLELTPAAVGQTVAVSDAEHADHQSFAYDWNSPEDAANVQKALQAQAAQLLNSATVSVTNPGTSTASARPAATKPGTGTAARRRAAKAQPATVPPLTEVKFSAFALSPGGGATLVLTAQEAAGPHSIALIGTEDIYGKVQVLWSSITDDAHLDITPRMSLVDAVDPRGDGRADLLFEQRNATERRFVLYAVGAAGAEQVFATDPLPLHPVAQPGE
jgi:hypothetical protein